MRALDAARKTLKSRRFWKWELGSMALYALPVAIRTVTRNPVIPILDPSFASPSPYIPGNPLEKILVNAFFPGGAGGVGGEIFYENYASKEPTRKQKYLSRLTGALAQAGVFTLLQYAGNTQNIIGTHGQNIFEPPELYPFNFLLATLSIFTPNVVDYVKSKLS